MSSIIRIYKHFIVFERQTNLEEDRKTEIWHVKTKDLKTMIGTIKWFGRFFKYSFFPAPDTVFEHVCLNDIADFCVELDVNRRAAKKAS